MKTKTRTLGVTVAVAAVMSSACSGSVASDSGRGNGIGTAGNGGGGGGLSDSGSSSQGHVAERCILNSDCASPLICVFGQCHAACSNDRDCAAGQTCIVGSNGNVCQLANEARCTFNTDCPSPLVCSQDGQCRNSCIADRDCAAGQSCQGSVCRDARVIVTTLADAGDPGNGYSTCVFPPRQNDVIDRPGSPPFVECYGCHPALFTPPQDQPKGPFPACAGGTMGGPLDLPCGVCDTPGYQCGMGISAFCDCDGRGPKPAFLDENYVDQWLCTCTGGSWNCSIFAISGSSCQVCSSPGR